MVSKWSSEDVVKFLDVYEECEDVWNIRHSDYNNKIKRDSAVLKLMGELLTLRRLMSYIYIYMEHPFMMFLDHTQRRSTVGRTPLDE